MVRREAGRMVAALTHVLGAENLSLAEDVMQESLVQALLTWPFRGVPENPGGWAGPPGHQCPGGVRS